MSGGADEPNVVVVGAGPAGLTAAHELVHRGVLPVVFEADDVVGGIARTVEIDGWRFDIGGHRFFTKVPEVEARWFEILPLDEWMRRPRMSRILYNGTLFDYPLRPANALRGLGPVEAVRCVLSYLWVKVRPPRDRSTFEGWVAARFGWRLYRTFFKTYTEKVWGVPATEIQADWAAQRIRNLSLLAAVLEPLRSRLRRSRGTDHTSLITEFWYPKLGPGMLWERCRDQVVAAGGRVELGAAVSRIRHEPGQGAVEVTARRADGSEQAVPCSQVISSMPLADLVRALDPPAPEPVRRAADGLRHRDFLTVALVVPDDAGFPDNWIYVHSPSVRVGRIQNFGSWSPHLVHPGSTCLGLEYFVNEGDELWARPDDELVLLAVAELAQLQLVPTDAIAHGFVVRMPKAYPVYDEGYEGRVRVIRDWLEANLPNVHPVGRNGMHRYNNQDHSMLTAMVAVGNLLGDEPQDVWAVNVEDEYHEEGGVATGERAGGTGRAAPVVPAPARQPGLDPSPSTEP